MKFQLSIIYVVLLLLSIGLDLQAQETTDQKTEAVSTDCDSPLSNCPKAYDKRLTTPPEVQSDARAQRLSGKQTAPPAKVKTPAEATE